MQLIIFIHRSFNMEDLEMSNRRPMDSYDIILGASGERFYDHWSKP